MQHFISQIADGHTTMASLINRDGMQTRQQIHQSEVRVKNSINAVHAEADLEAKRNRLLQSLKFESMNARRTDIKIANEATYGSFFTSLEFATKPTSGSAAATWANFVSWLQSQEQIFWIQGKPGAGKSTLVKFLLQHENTSKALNKWNHNPLIVSHFFWKPGNILQRNLRGLLCSLTHQLLSGQPGLIDKILSDFKVTNENDSIGDWEISHLVTIFKCIVMHHNRPIFFLIDGVDEAADAEEIIKFLTSSITLRNTKWCISSRGEQIFQQAFSKYKGFKLSEYTRDDMLAFSQKEIQEALANIQGYETMYTEPFLEELQHILVDKAEGVYLWLVLALESIKRGLQNYDEEDTIRSRLRKLPTGLEELYADMWDRLGEDQDIYREEAVRYFKLLITQRTLAEEYQKQYEGFNFRPEWSLTLFQTMLAQHDELQRKFLDESYELQLSDLEKKCSGTMKAISIKTAGLLVGTGKSKSRWSDLKVRAEYSQLGHYAASRIDFLHRTLFDFLTDTTAGKDILSQTQADLSYVQLATTMLCQLRIMTAASENPLTGVELHLKGGSLHCFRWLLNQALRDDNDRVFNTLLPAYEALFEAGLIPWDQRANKYPRPCFDILLLGDIAFQPFIKERLKSKGASYATRVLREYMFVGDVEVSRFHALGVNIPEFFQDLGADINSSAACFYDPPVGAGQFAGCCTYESAFSQFVKVLYSTSPRGRFFAYSRGVYEQLKCLVAFLETSPDLNAHTCCLMESAQWTHPEASDWNLRLLLSALSELKHSFGIRGEYQTSIIITEVNLKCLVKYYLENSLSNDSAANALMTHALQLVQGESSKPYIKARFLVTLRLSRLDSTLHSATCHRFVNEDVDVFSGLEKPEYRAHEFVPTFKISWQKAQEYKKVCEEVDVPALSVLLDQKLGVCFQGS